MTLTRTRRSLERQLRGTLHAKAHQVSLEAEAASGEDDAWVAPVIDTAPRSPRRARRPLVIAAVSIVVLLAVVGIVVLGGGSSSRDQAPSTTIAPAGSALGSPVTGPALLPAHAPDGMQLWSLTTQPQGSTNPNAVTQLFGKLDGNGAPSPGLLIEMQVTSPGSEVFPGATEHVTVRGQQAAVVGSKDGGAAGSEIDWIEDNVWMRVTFRGISPADAAAFVDRLQPRDGVLVHGFDPVGATGGLTLLGEHVSAAGATPGSATDVEAYAEYGTAAPRAGAPGDIFVRTTSTYGYPGRLRLWIAGSGDANGSRQFDPDIGLTVARADGTQVTVGPPTVDRAVLDRVADSVTRQDQAAVRAIADDLDARLRRLPVIATTKLGSVTYELRGDGGPTTVCASTDAAASVCSSPFGQSDLRDFAAPEYALGSATLDGQWLVFAAAPTLATLSLPPNATLASLPVPGQQHASIGAWQLTSVTVPAGVNQVNVSTDASSFQGLFRPSGPG